MKRITRYYVILDVQGDPSDAYHAIDNELDAGMLQDAINDVPGLRVKMAIVRTDPTDIGPAHESQCGTCGKRYADPYADEEGCAEHREVRT